MPQTAQQPDYQTESVSAGRVSFGTQSLAPQNFDRDLPKFDALAVRAMRRDAEVHAAVEFLVDAILSDGITFTGAQFEGDAEFEQAEEIKSFIERCLMEAPTTSFIPTLKELIRGAIYNGHKVAEIVTRLEQYGDDKGREVLDRLKIKPNKATAFVVDEFYNVLGLIGISKNQYSLPVGTVAPQNIIQKEKFLICTLETEDGDPRGVRQVVAAFEPFCDKKETRKQFSVWRRKCAVRSFIAEAPQNAQPVQKFGADGKPVGAPVSATQSIADTLARMQNDTVAAVPNGTNVQALDSDGNGEQFKLSYDLNNTEIRKSILLSTQATGEPDKGGLGSGGHSTHERALGRRVNSFRTVVSDQIYDLARTFVLLNFGADKLHLTPKASLGNFDKSELESKRKFYTDAGYTLDASQFDEIDAETGAPRRDMQAQMGNTSDGFVIGDRVKIKGKPHMEGQSEGEIALVDDSTAYGIIFDGMEEMGVHKWYVGDEIEPVNQSADSGKEQAAGKKDSTKGQMK